MNFADSAYLSDFGVDATLNGSTTVRGIFNAPWVSVMSGAVGGNTPTFVTQSALAIAMGDTLQIGAASWRVTYTEADNTGISTHHLEQLS